MSTSQINLSWADGSLNEDGFRIERSTSATGTFTQIGQTAPNTTTFASTGLNAATAYFYRVRAFNTAGSSAYSNVANATTMSVQPPGDPSGLVATANSSSQITLTWVDNATTETGFKIERSSDNVTFTQIATAATNATSYVNTGLTPLTRYYYRVRSTNTGGDSAYSNAANATTADAIPAGPLNLSGKASSPTRIDLTWVDNSSNETGFMLERSLGNGAFTQIALLPANTKSFADTGLTPATSYRYRIRSYNALGNSTYSNSSSIRTPSR
jgi:titin